MSSFWKPSKLCDSLRTGGEGFPSHTILIVEDYTPNLIIVSLMLEDMGFAVVAVESGTQALHILRKRTQPFSAILMDVQMQEIDGLETTRQLRKLEKKKGFRHPVIGITAHALAGDRERCISAGMDDYLSKPIHPDILEARLKMVMKAQE